jgi:Ni/Co efflux regulator RcnB
MQRRTGVKIVYVNKVSRVLFILAVAVVLTTSACDQAKKEKKAKKHPEQSHFKYDRDWNRFPAIVERNTSAEVIALGDVHGGYERLVNLLSIAGLIKSDAQAPSGYSWTGGNRLLVSVGDLIDKGDQSIEVLDLMMKLESKAAAAGGEVIVTLGNHEVEFLANPENKKAHEFVAELHSKGIEPNTLPQDEKPYGEWLMNRPLAARVNDWFFSHAGNTSGKTIAELAEAFRHDVNQGDWGSNFLIGDDSLLEAEKWWKGEGQAAKLLDDYLRAINVKHIAFGHDPGAFHDKGQIGQEKDGRIFLIDVGMSPAVDYSKGALLLIDTAGGSVVATTLDADGTKKEIWRAPASNLSK